MKLLEEEIEEGEGDDDINVVSRAIAIGFEQ